MWKLIFLGLIIGLAVHILKRVISPHETDHSNKTPPDNANHEIENMVQCTTCAVHLPRSEAFLVDGKFYCCQAHIKRK